LNKGILYAGAAFVSWGILPVFWKQLQHVPPEQALAHRIVWCFVLLVLFQLLSGRTAWLGMIKKNPASALPFMGTALLLGINWFVYIWAINASFIVETSLVYFINPIVSVLLGVLFLHERVRAWQWLAIGVAVAGVSWLTFSYGALPWIALTLAVSFAFYGLVRKTASYGSLEGLSLEVGILFFFALGYLVYVAQAGAGAFGHVDRVTDALLAASGLLTAIPLLLFAAGARRIRLVSVGLLQYLAPTLQLIIGVGLYGEPFPTERVVGFSLIWAALLIYSVEAIVRARHLGKIRFVD